MRLLASEEVQKLLTAKVAKIGAKVAKGMWGWHRTGTRGPSTSLGMTGVMIRGMVRRGQFTSRV